MKMDKYFLIWNSEDGTRIEQLTKEELLRHITPDEHGYHYFGDGELKFLNYIPSNYGNLEMDGVIIIKGDFVIPKEQKVVVKYEV